MTNLIQCTCKIEIIYKGSINYVESSLKVQNLLSLAVHTLWINKLMAFFAKLVKKDRNAIQPCQVQRNLSGSILSTNINHICTYLEFGFLSWNIRIFTDSV